MISLLLILAIWVALIRFFLPADSSYHPSSSLFQWGLLFVASLAILFLIGYIQINLLPSLWWNRAFLFIESIAASAFLLIQFFQRRLLSSLLLPFYDNGWIVRLLTLVIFGLLTAFAMMTSSPINWDTNAYNLARIPSMLAVGSTILSPETASARQAIYSLGHDLLFYPDLAFGILRGLPLVPVLEFMVLWAMLLGVTKVLFSNIDISERTNIQLRSHLGLALTSVFLLNSHQQVMQAVISKNDLIVTLLFVLSLSFGVIGLLRNTDAFNQSVSIVVMIFLLAYGVSCKSYGLILAIPLILYLSVLLLRRQLISSIRRFSFFTKPLASLLLILVIMLVASSQIQSGLVGQAWADSTERVAGITSTWVNTHGSVSERFVYFVVNAQRILLQCLLFPFTALKPYLPIGPEMTSFVSDDWIPSWLRGSFGSAGGAYPFHLFYGTNPDMAYPFLILQLGLLFGCFSLFWNRVRYGSVLLLFIGTSSFLTYLFFSFAILYQPWLSRFLGPVYIPLIPVASVGIVIVFASAYRKKSAFASIRSQVLSVVAVLVGVFPVISSLSSTAYISRRSGMPQGLSAFYDQYVWSQTSLSQLQSKELIHTIRDRGFDQRTFCATDGVWTLTPMVISQSSSSFNENVRLISKEACAKELGVEDLLNLEFGSDQSLDSEGRQYIKLP